MIARLWRWVTGRPSNLAPCWCGSLHDLGYWHDPTGGRIDQDIQEHARELLDIPVNASLSIVAAVRPGVVGQLRTMESNLQGLRAEGKRLWWERDEALRDERTNR